MSNALSPFIYRPLVCALGFALSGCSHTLIQPVAGSTQVRLATPQQLTGCIARGKISVSVLAKIGGYTRDMHAVDENLLQLGRNEAASLGADTLVKEPTAEYGKQVFSVYHCHL